MENIRNGLLLGLLCFTGVLHAQKDTIEEHFNGICDQTVTPGRTYHLDYTGKDGVEWNIKTLYSSSSWWGGIDDKGNPVTGVVHCGSLQWDEDNEGYAKATINQGISTLSFQMRYGFQLVGGYVRVLVNREEIGRTDTLIDKDIHTFVFDVHTAGPLELELIPVVESSKPGGIIVDNLTIITSGQSIPFSNVKVLDEYVPWMDTLMPSYDTIELYIYAEHCLELNGEFVDYFEQTDDAEVIVGSVIDLIPGDSCNLYYWGSAQPAIGTSGGEVSVGLELPVNSGAGTIDFSTMEGEDIKEGMLSFINGNVDYDLVVFKLSDLQHEYRLRYTYDHYMIVDSSTTSSHYPEPHQPLSPHSVRFYPNPVSHDAIFQTSKPLDYFEVFNLDGRKLHTERNPAISGHGDQHYRLNLELLDAGIFIIRLHYSDHTAEAVKVLVE